MVANQVRVYGLSPEARSRLTTAYMACAYAGGSAGSWLGARVYDGAGWPGVCVLVASLATLALARHLLRNRQIRNVMYPTLPEPVRRVHDSDHEFRN